MKRLMPPAIVAAAAAATLAFTLPTAAQTVLDMAALEEIEDAEVVGADGNEIGDVDEVLIDRNGRVVAMVVEIDTGFLGLDERELVFTFDQLAFKDGDYVTSLTSEEIAVLPVWDD